MIVICLPRCLNVRALETPPTAVTATLVSSAAKEAAFILSIASLSAAKGSPSNICASVAVAVAAVDLLLFLDEVIDPSFLASFFG